MSAPVVGTAIPWTPGWAPEAVDDLRARLRSTRRALSSFGRAWSEGTDPSYLTGLLAYWADGFDFAQGEAEVARHPWFEADVACGAQSPLRLRFIHLRGAERTGGRAPLPLLLCHGWPDSAWRYQDVIDQLADPASHGGDPDESFDVVVPDMPGYGFSPAPGQVIDSIGVAHAFAALMRDLGYERYAVAGGDIGSSVARFIALEHPADVVAVHRMDAGIPVFAGEPATLSAEERAFLDAAAAWAAREGAYAAMHRTKPATIAAALSDSPAGLAAWTVEKLHAWSDSSHGPVGGFTRDAILSLLTTVWTENSTGPSMRMYRANAAIPADQHSRRVEVPSGFSFFPADLLTPPRAWLERIANVTSVSYPGSGGHFAPREAPEVYAQELRAFFRSSW